MACPLIDSVAESYSETIVMAGPLVQQILWDRKDRIRLETGHKISGVGPVLRAARQIRHLGVGSAFILNRSFRSALAVRLAGIPVRVGHSTEGRGFLLTHRTAYDESRFEAECFLDLIRLLDVPAVAFRPTLTAQGEESAALGEAEIGLQPGARYPEKQIPLAVMAEVAAHLQSQGRKIALFGGEDETEAASQFEDMLAEKPINLVGRLPIRKTLATLARLRAMVGSDTGLMHLAAAVGCPTVTVFGPNPAAKWGHRYPPHQVLEAPGGSMARTDPDALLAAVRTIYGL